MSREQLKFLGALCAAGAGAVMGTWGALYAMAAAFEWFWNWLKT